MLTKLCGVCKEVKNIYEFGKDKRNSGGVRYCCKLCRKLEYNPGKKSLYNKKWFQKNKDRIYRLAKIYKKKNINRIREYKNNWVKNRTKSDINYRLRVNLRSRIRCALKNNSKKGSAIRDLGCDINELKVYLESKFYPNPITGEMMTWDNYGNKNSNWNIDHIYPLSKTDLTDINEFKKVSHYTNLQPLWRLDNIKKGNKIVNQL